MLVVIADVWGDIRTADTMWLGAFVSLVAVGAVTQHKWPGIPVPGLPQAVYDPIDARGQVGPHIRLAAAWGDRPRVVASHAIYQRAKSRPCIAAPVREPLAHAVSSVVEHRGFCVGRQIRRSEIGFTHILTGGN